MNLDIIVLTKNNPVEFIKTLASIPDVPTELHVRIVVVDGSDDSGYACNFLHSLRPSTLRYSYVNSAAAGIHGIYPSMNFGLSLVRADWFIYMNSGDLFAPGFSFASLIKFFSNERCNVIFGQSIVLSSALHHRCSWIVPSPAIKNLRLWLKFFEPSHQSMFVRGSLAKIYLFDEQCSIGADALWKRKLLVSEPYFYYKGVTSMFFLGGISSTYSFSKLLIKIREPSRRPLEKLMEILKYLLHKMGLMSPWLQKAKSEFIGMLL